MSRSNADPEIIEGEEPCFLTKDLNEQRTKRNHAIIEWALMVRDVQTRGKTLREKRFYTTDEVLLSENILEEARRLSPLLYSEISGKFHSSEGRKNRESTKALGEILGLNQRNEDLLIRECFRGEHYGVDGYLRKVLNPFGLIHYSPIFITSFAHQGQVLKWEIQINPQRRYDKKTYPERIIHEFLAKEATVIEATGERLPVLFAFPDGINPELFSSIPREIGSLKSLFSGVASEVKRACPTAFSAVKSKISPNSGGIALLIE